MCWASFITGATPEVHGIVSDQLHLSGDLSHPDSGYNCKFLLTERFWESAAKAGKTVFVGTFPMAGSSHGYSAGTVHADQIPTAQNAFGTMRSLGILSGPGIPESTDWEKPLNLIDLAPTLCARLSVPLPKGCSGRIVEEFVGKGF